MKFLNSPSSGPHYSPVGCVPAILRRLLCFHALPTFPLDNHIQNSYEFEDGNKPKGDPGIVGKLMGLDSMPAVDNWRQVKLGAFVELENDKFIIFSFEGDDGKMGFSRNQKGKLSKKSTTESHSENSSPVSVLEFSQQASFSGNDHSHSKNSNSRRKLRGDLDIDKNAPSPLSSSSSSSSSSTSSCEELCGNGNECVGFEKNKFVTRESKEMWDEMAERDVMETWKAEEDFGDEIGVCLEMQILDHLILELFTIT